MKAGVITRASGTQGSWLPLVGGARLTSVGHALHPPVERGEVAAAQRFLEAGRELAVVGAEAGSGGVAARLERARQRRAQVARVQRAEHAEGQLVRAQLVLREPAGRARCPARRCGRSGSSARAPRRGGWREHRLRPASAATAASAAWRARSPGRGGPARAPPTAAVRQASGVAPLAISSGSTGQNAGSRAASVSGQIGRPRGGDVLGRQAAGDVAAAALLQRALDAVQLEAGGRVAVGELVVDVHHHQRRRAAAGQQRADRQGAERRARRCRGFMGDVDGCPTAVTGAGSIKKRAPGQN